MSEGNVRQKELRKGSLVGYFSNAKCRYKKSDDYPYQCAATCVRPSALLFTTVSATTVLLLLVVAKSAYIPDFLSNL